MYTHNLRMYRKRARLIQEDIAFICAMTDWANVSRMENGMRKPSLEILLVYHFLFDMPIEEMFEDVGNKVKDLVVERIAKRIELLKKQTQDSKLAYRIAFLSACLTRLGSMQTV